jgi:DNA-binding transcriptional ArsR family regulator
MYRIERAIVASVNSHVNPSFRMLSALADPLRFAVARHLMAGPATVSELGAHTGASQANLSNHLAILRGAGIVEAQRQGRFAVYALAGHRIARAIEALEAASGEPAPQSRSAPDLTVARRCYDHLAGRLGVALFAALVRKRAVLPVKAAPVRKVRSGLGPVRLGDEALAVFGSLAIDLDATANPRRQFATACSDWTETAPHLGGSLGAALADAMLRERWLVRRAGTRALRITPDGAAELARRFSIDVDTLREL